ncbi:MAG: MFS transporter [Actinomycetota bacterium]|nr:MFS transporter [Actinomycetota bacterium]
MKTDPRRTPSPLRHRAFRLYFTGSMISNSGTWLQNVALSVFMLNITHRSTWVGITGLALMLPVVFLTLPAGVLADRVDRLKLLLISQLVAAGFAAVLTVLAAAHTITRYTVVGLAMGLGASVAFAIPAMQALIPHLVPEDELEGAIAMNAITFNIGRVIGPILAALTPLLFHDNWPVWAFGLNTASFLVLAVLLSRMGPPPYPRPGGGPGPVSEAIDYAWHHVRTRWMLLGVIAIGFTLDPIFTLSPAIGRSFGRSSYAGWIVSVWGAGAVFVITAGASVLRYLTKHGLGWVGLVVLAAGIAGFSAAQNLAEALGAVFVTGGGYIAAAMTFTTTIQTDVPERLRGRVMALWTLAFLGPRPIAGIIDGSLADVLSPHWAGVLFALPAIVMSVAVRRGALRGGQAVAPPV